MGKTIINTLKSWVFLQWVFIVISVIYVFGGDYRSARQILMVSLFCSLFQRLEKIEEKLNK